MPKASPETSFHVKSIKVIMEEASESAEIRSISSYGERNILSFRPLSGDENFGFLSGMLHGAEG